NPRRYRGKDANWWLEKTRQGFWTSVGAVWAHDDGDGMSLKLHLLRADICAIFRRCVETARDKARLSSFRVGTAHQRTTRSHGLTTTRHIRPSARLELMPKANVTKTDTS